MDQFDPNTQKIQYALYGINGELYKQGFVSTRKRLMTSRNTHSKKYGWGLSLRWVSVPKEQKAFSPMPHSLGKAYCYCPETPLSAHKCDKCGKSPYTD